MTGEPSGDLAADCRRRWRQGGSSRVRPSVVLVPLLVFALVGLTGAGVASAQSTTTTGPSGGATPVALPVPRPSQVDASGTVSAFPAPGTPTASPTTTITLRGAGAAALGTIQVTGAKSGSHAGLFQPHADGLGTTFVPDAAFTPGERVTVGTGLSVRGGTNGEYTFTAARPTTFPSSSTATTSTSTQASPGDLQHFVTRPDLTPPALTVTTPAKNTSPGDIFLTPAGGDTQHGPLIVDNQGQPVWALPVSNTSVLNLQVQQYRGQPVLTWFQGPIVNPGIGQGMDVIADASYRPIAQVRAVNGYAADLHDMTITPQGTALLNIYNPVLVDASSVGGGKSQPVLEPVVQEIDIATGALLFEWHGLASIALKESHEPVPNSGSATFDYVHPNSIALDQDGNVLVSGRHTWTVYKIDRVSATLDWRLGGKLDNFTMPTSAEPAWQHDARRNTDGTLSVFDDGAAGSTVTHKSRGLVLRINEQAMTATLDHQYSPPKPIQSTSQGSFRLLANGDWFAGWGDQPEYTEYAPDGTVVYDVHLPSSSAGTVTSYRALRYPWTGQPTDLPAVAAKRAGGDATTVYVSWNGATEVATWAVLAGPDTAHLARVTTAPKQGFETAIQMTSNEPYYAVQALDASGAVLATSAPTTPRP
jgi:hypothetical protein